MHALQEQIIAEMGVKPRIDPAQEVADRVRFLADYALSARAKGFVLGISGGVDSTLGGRLTQMAAELLRSEGHEATFIAVRLPHGVQADEADASAAMDFVAADVEHTVNIEPGTSALVEATDAASGRELSDFDRGNVKARLRMTVQYAIAGDRDLLVIGTDQAAESVSGFFTKFGDGGADVLPLFGLNKRQVRQLLQHLDAPEPLWAKVPTADLLDDKPLQTDEAELGIAYDTIDDYLEGREVAQDAAELIERRYLATRHKRTTPASILDDWWREG
ncbi:ammonia-dependent NAD(+) synthetase [Brachybacterium sp. UMB0905]|uniref:ammonia-dependent NAD(+) synthetase n=1 Tax=Brachybacterium sp. UMB0905 TaxID=2069310 RepID=UPI000C800675|nr:ammonia-dependent NAD(+) synthetase [Brachybacterium sp. UMB0905]PMC76051.1 NAD(+) synthase [Brachybacterium sp. UMB0905]